MTKIEAGNVTSNIWPLFRGVAFKSFEELYWFSSIIEQPNEWIWWRLPAILGKIILPMNLKVLRHLFINHSGYSNNLTPGTCVEFPESFERFEDQILCANNDNTNNYCPSYVQYIIMRNPTPPNGSTLVREVVPANADRYQRVMYIPAESEEAYLAKGWVQAMIEAGWEISATL